MRMADILPDYHVEQQRLVVQISSLKTNLERFKLEVMDLDSRRAKAVGNYEASIIALSEAESNLQALIDVHGEPPDLAL